MTIIIGVILVLINSSAQILLKVGATDSKYNVKVFLISIFTLIGYGLFFISTVLSVYMLNMIEFKSFTMIIAFNYVVTLIFSKLFLSEKFTTRKIISTLLIITGVIVFNL